MTNSGDNATPRSAGLILFVGGADADAVRIAKALESLADVAVVEPGEAMSAVSRLDFDVIVVDGDEGERGRLALAEAVTVRAGAVRILLGEPLPNGAGSEAAAPAVLPKPVDVRALRALCSVGLECAAAQRAARDLENENHYLRGVGTDAAALPADDAGDLERYEGIVTRSPEMKRVLGLLRKIEDSDTSVLIQGETGTGKELVAQAIHARSRRRKGRFVAVNLGAISDPLRESELFGHLRGAFTGAVDNRRGLFVEANGGTIFLDEVGDASPGLQVALLRVLEEATITPVGSDRPRRVDVRVISGTNHNLEERVRDGLFRRDLYYRLNVFPIELPPLRERPEDIFPLANHFLALATLAMGKKPPGISREARASLEGYHWEGNVRELRNVMERGAILCKGGLVIAADLPMAWDRKPTTAGGPAAAVIAIPPGGASLADLEREIFAKTLALAGGNQSHAARILGLCESTFRFRLRKLGLVSQREAARAPQSPARAQLAANG